VPEGTWMISMKIDDDELYNKAKEGEIKGFSIEGYFADKYDLQKDDKNQEIIKQLKDLLK
jgi:adenylylsulfate kinase-like enzyme